ncbi:MAG: HIT domain-containing protein [Lachnospiraceae bacterium]|nr:HIT domain-containing protein [Lachnospiraceae bacterium]
MIHKNNDCIFCKIISGERPCKKVYEDEYTLVTMDKAGDADGHMLVMPKKHVNNIMDTDIESLNQMMATVKRCPIIAWTTADTKELT